MRMIGIPKNFIGARPGRVYSWGGSASIQTASGTVVTFPQAEERAFSGVNVYGHSTQSGTPSPENPVPILSAGSVMTTGKNVLPPEPGAEVHMNIPAGTKCFLVTDGTPSKGGNIYLYDAEGNIRYLAIEAGDTEGAIRNGTTYIVDIVRFVNRLVPGVNTAMYIGEKLPYEPYTGGIPGVNPYEGEINVTVSDGGTQSQTLTLSTPGGLPGVPVDSGGNYTDESGQQWVCDEIDLKRGKYVQRVGKGTLNSDNVPNQKVTTYDECDVLLYQISDMENFEGYRNLLCNKYGAFNGYWTDGLGKMSSNSGHVYFGVPKGESSISDGTEFVYPLETPIETDLTAEEIDDYQALHTYTPNTTVSNDAEAWMKVEYYSGQQKKL